MRSRVVLVSVILAVVMSLVPLRTQGVVDADAEIPMPDPVALLKANHKPIAKGRGWVFASASMKLTSKLDARNPAGDWRYCSAYDDPLCDPSLYKTMYASILLGLCQSDAEEACLESISTVDSTGKLTPMTFVSGGDTVIPASTATFGPRGTTATRWKTADGNHYLVSPEAQFWSSQVVDGRRAFSSVDWFNLYVQRVSAASESVVPIKFSPGSKFAVSVRLPSRFPSWFQGRLEDGTVSLKRNTNQSLTYQFIGGPATLAIPVMQIDYTKNPEMTNGVPIAFDVSTFEPGNSIHSFKSWVSQVEERAITTIEQWSVGSYSRTSGGCFVSTDRAAGLTVTNAGSYGQEPPTFDKATGQMKINVGSSHYDESGNVIVGKYSASLPLSVISCLYGPDFVPDQVEVTVSYDNGAETFKQTQAVSVEDNQVRISVSGFHYSAPTIALKLKQTKETPSIATPATRPTFKKGSSKSLSSITRTTAAQKAKWSAKGQCKISGSRVIALKKTGTCTVTLRVLNSKKKYFVKTTKTFTVK